MKLKEFQAELEKEDIDFALFLNSFGRLDSNLFYFSKFNGEGILIIPQKNPFMIVPELEYERAKNESSIQVYSSTRRNLLPSIAKKIKDEGLNHNKIGINRKAISFQEYLDLEKMFRKVEFVDISNICSKLRLIKTEEEINYIRKACEITDRALKETLDNFSKFTTEAEIAANLEYLIKREGCGIAFDTIVASGKNSALPHYTTTNSKLQGGFCVIDLGARYKGYCADMTRTIFIGKPTKEEKEIYNTLLKTQEKVLERITEGISINRLDKLARNLLGNYARYFIHSLSHSIGIEEHENLENNLRENMTLSIEPGIYFPDKCGIRIEDLVLVTKKSYEILTKTPKELLVIE